MTHVYLKRFTSVETMEQVAAFYTAAWVVSRCSAWIPRSFQTTAWKYVAKLLNFRLWVKKIPRWATVGVSYLSAIHRNSVMHHAERVLCVGGGCFESCSQGVHPWIGLALGDQLWFGSVDVGSLGPVHTLVTAMSETLRCGRQHRPSLLSAIRQSHNCRLCKNKQRSMSFDSSVTVLKHYT